MRCARPALLFTLALSLAASHARVAADTRIVGGSLAPDHAYPFLVAIEESADAFHFCGGTLIAPTKVLTAAHCLVGMASVPIQVRVGTNNASTDPGKVFQVVKRVRHPMYDDFRVDYDVAVLTLGSPVPTSGVANVIALPQACNSLTCITGLAKPGTVLRTAGWGATDPAGTRYPDSLRQVDLPVVDNATCNRAVGGITARMLCAGLVEGGKDSCSGDSGGPLFAYLPEGRAGLQGGIVSWGNGCAEAGQYGAYTRISHPEIRAFIKEHSGV
jgi:trypsin